MHFPFADHHGVMDGRWHRQGDALHITSHDQVHAAGGTNHVHSDLRLRRRPGATKGISALP